MQALKSTAAHEIDKASITEAETLVFEGRIVRQSGQLKMKPGEFYFRPRTAMRSVPNSCFRRVILRHPFTLKTAIVNTVVIACPFCDQPILTTCDHKITERNPLTIATEIRCPYSRTEDGGSHGFFVKAGTITPA